MLTEVIDSWDEQLGILAAADIFGLWITESSDDINIRGGESKKHKTISTIPVAVVVPALVCVSWIIVQRIKMSTSLHHRGWAHLSFTINTSWLEKRKEVQTTCFSYPGAAIDDRLYN